MRCMRVPHFEQELSYSCLPACIRMVAAFYGVEQSEAALRALLKTRPAGTSPVQAMLRLPEIVPLPLFLQAWSATDYLLVVVSPAW